MSPVGFGGMMIHPRSNGNVTPTTPVFTNLTGWWNSDSSNVILVEGAVSRATDLSGNLVDLIQSTPGKRPTIATAAINGKDAMVFDFVDDQLATSDPISSLISATNAYVYTIGRVPTFRSNSSPSYVNQAWWGDFSAYCGLFFKSASGGQALAYNWDGNEDVATTTYTSTSYNLITWRHTDDGTPGGKKLGIRINNGSWTETASDDTQLLTGTLCLSGSSGGWDVCIAEMFIYNINVSGANDIINLAYINGRYALW